MSESFAGIAVPKGEPGSLRSAGQTFAGLSGALEGVSGEMRGMPGLLGAWRGPASVNYAGSCLTNGAAIDSGTEALQSCSVAASRYADDLDEAQDEARKAIDKAREAQRRIDRAQSDIEDAQGRAGAGALNLMTASARVVATGLSGAPSPDALADQSAAQQAIGDAERDEGRARRELEQAEDDLKRAQRRGRKAEEAADDAAQAAAGAFGAASGASPAAAAFGAPGSASAGGGGNVFFDLASPGAGLALTGPLAIALAGRQAAPSTDYRSWQDPERRQIEQEQLYGDAKPATEEFDIEDLDGLDEGKLRFGLFIAAPSAGAEGFWHGLGLQRGEGNNRGFNRQFSPNQTKAYIELDFERDRAYIQSNPSCEADGSDCESAKDIAQDDIWNVGDYKSEVEPNDTDGDEVHISWELSNSKGMFRGDLPLIDSPGSGGPSIDGDLHVRPGPDGRPIVELDGDDYPSREIYYDDGQGRTYDVIRPRPEDDGQYLPGDGTTKLFPGFN